MLEAKLEEASTLKRLLDAIKELVSDANFQCNDEGISLQAMDNSHVALVAVQLERDGFSRFRCDRPLPLGVNLGALTKILKCAKDDDVCIIKAADDSDVLNLTYEAKNADRISDYELKLMDIDADTLGIPDTEYDAKVIMPSSEFSRIVRDLSGLGESVKIEVSKDGIRFTSDGESANGNILLKQTESAKRRFKNIGKRTKAGSSGDNHGENEDEVKEEENDDEVKEDENEDEEGEKKKKKKIKKEKVKSEDDGDVDMENDEGEKEYKSGNEEEAQSEEEQEDTNNKKRKKAPSKKSSKPAKKVKKAPEEEEDDGAGGVSIEMNQAVSLTFSLKYLVNFSKSSSLAKEVQLMMSTDVPLLVSYDFQQGTINYYLAPKIGDE